mmetsp:Transcript_46261/g.72382  ORF Transcript_46261/g.72382 Transcript_46261/m.72382 type:complete len:83 (-) Transcript_46261:41-289(-)
MMREGTQLVHPVRTQKWLKKDATPTKELFRSGNLSLLTFFTLINIDDEVLLTPDVRNSEALLLSFFFFAKHRNFCFFSTRKK